LLLNRLVKCLFVVFPPTLFDRRRFIIIVSEQIVRMLHCLFLH
jgi:hypothetical protein